MGRGGGAGDPTRGRAQSTWVTWAWRGVKREMRRGFGRWTVRHPRWWRQLGEADRAQAVAGGERSGPGPLKDVGQVEGLLGAGSGPMAVAGTPIQPR